MKNPTHFWKQLLLYYNRMFLTKEDVVLDYVKWLYVPRCDSYHEFALLIQLSCHLSAIIDQFGSVAGSGREPASAKLPNSATLYCYSIVYRPCKLQCNRQLGPSCNQVLVKPMVFYGKGLKGRLSKATRAADRGLARRRDSLRLLVRETHGIMPGITSY